MRVLDWPLVIMIWALGVGFCLWGSGADMTVQQWLWVNVPENVSTIAQTLGRWSEGWVLMLICASIAMVLGFQSNPHWYVWFMTLPAYVLSGLFNWMIKIAVGKPRPKEVFWNNINPFDIHSFHNSATFWSFPSGHTASAFAMACVLAWGFPRGRIAFIFLATVIAVSRVIALTPHFIGDIVAGAGLGIASGLFIITYIGDRHHG